MPRLFPSCLLTDLAHYLQKRNCLASKHLQHKVPKPRVPRIQALIFMSPSVIAQRFWVGYCVEGNLQGRMRMCLVLCSPRCDTRSPPRSIEEQRRMVGREAPRHQKDATRGEKQSWYGDALQLTFGPFREGMQRFKQPTVLQHMLSAVSLPLSCELLTCFNKQFYGQGVDFYSKSWITFLQGSSIEYFQLCFFLFFIYFNFIALHYISLQSLILKLKFYY